VGFEGLPSPKEDILQRKEKMKQENNQASLLQQMNKTLEQMVIDNKRLEAIVLGTPVVHPSKKGKFSNTKRKEIASRLAIDDPRQMEELSRAAEHDLRKFGANLSDCNTEDETDNERSWKASHNSGKRATKLRSGKTARITTCGVKPQIWPHSELSLCYVSKDVVYDELIIEEFVAGYSTILSHPKINASEQQASLQHLTRLMYLATQYEWSAVTRFPYHCIA
jgi:hypothetical protein